MLGHADTGAELHPAMGKVIEGSHFLRQPDGVVEGQLVDHDTDAELGGLLGHSAKVNAGGGYLSHVGVLMLDDVVRLVTQLFGHHGLFQMLVVDVGGGGRQRHLVFPESVP